MNRKFLTVTIHIAAWICFFVLPIVFSPKARDPNFQYNESFVHMVVWLDVFLVAFYYLNTHVLIPQLLTRRKWVWYILSIITCFVLYATLSRLLEGGIQGDLPEDVRRKMEFRRRAFLYPFKGSYAVFFLVFTVSTCMRVTQEWLGIEKKRQEIETEKLATELSFLRTQINPHFLFNTLNNIYSLALVKSDATAIAVMKLSSIMRYVLSETKMDVVALDKEIEFIRHYIELQKIRVTDKVTIDFTVTGPTSEATIAPLIFIPFVENAFKYGISTKDQSNISFTITTDGKAIEFTAQNRIAATEIDSFEKNGIGIKNTKRRLELLYPHKHTLTVTHKDDQFFVHLKINDHAVYSDR